MGESEHPACSLKEMTAMLSVEHAHLAEQLLPRIEELVVQVATEAGPTADDALVMRSRVLAFHAELSRLFDREEKGVFPMLGRLESSTLVSPCHAGMVKSRVRFAVIEQEPVMAALAQLKAAARACPAAACRGVLELLEQFDAVLSAHMKREREALFPQAVELEETLSCKTATEAPPNDSP